MRPHQMLPIWIEMNSGAMVMKRHSTLPKALGQVSHHQIVSWTRHFSGRGFNPLQKWSRSILQPQLCRFTRVGLQIVLKLKWIMDEKLIFFEIVSEVFNTCSSEFFIGWSTSETSFFIMAWSCINVFKKYLSYPPISSPCDEFSVDCLLGFMAYQPL